MANCPKSPSYELHTFDRHLPPARWAFHATPAHRCTRPPSARSRRTSESPRAPAHQPRLATNGHDHTGARNMAGSLPTTPASASRAGSARTPGAAPCWPPWPLRHQDDDARTGTPGRGCASQSGCPSESARCVRLGWLRRYLRLRLAALVQRTYPLAGSLIRRRAKIGVTDSLVLPCDAFEIESAPCVSSGPGRSPCTPPNPHGFRRYTCLVGCVKWKECV